MKDKSIEVSISLKVGAVEFKVEVKKEKSTSEPARIQTPETFKYIDMKAN
ncbi:MAG: hypothetical protein K2I00_11215 [Ruminococcus sp.]|nr:hypothetical protein [Ruminococcus sp.]